MANGWQQRFESHGTVSFIKWVSISPLQFPAKYPSRVGFISTRFHGTDGVTLEAKKWAAIISETGSECCWMAGLLDSRLPRQKSEPLAFFNHPRVAQLQAALFGRTQRTRGLTNEIHSLKELLKDSLYAFIDEFQIELLIPQNILAIPMHVPLGLAMAEVIAESGLPTVAHHHDFTWERERFTVSNIGDYLQAAFPPCLPQIEHVVINSMAQKELSRRFGLSSTLIPNILDFETPPPQIDDFNYDLRQAIGLQPDDLFVLQPTRIVARKGIEHAIELVRQLKHPKAKLVISHPAGDEGDDYFRFIKERIEDAGIDARFIADLIGEEREITESGQKKYTLFDVYLHADLVTYPSLYEGFGNAFLEALYFGKPVVVNRYAVYARDIAPLGFKTITMDNVVTRAVVNETRTVLADAQLRETWAAINYDLGRKYFSHAVARRKLAARSAALFGEGF